MDQEDPTDASTVSTIFSSMVLGAPQYVVAARLKALDGIESYGVRGGVISCCVLEDHHLTPATVGATRRCTLAMPGYRGAMLRERLLAAHDVTAEAVLVVDRMRADSKSRATDSVGGRTAQCAAPESSAGRSEGMKECVRSTIELQYVPCGAAERQRAAFPHEDQLLSARMTYTVATVASSVNHTYVEAQTTLTFRQLPGASAPVSSSSIQHVSGADRVHHTGAVRGGGAALFDAPSGEAAADAGRAAQRAIAAFWRSYTRSVLRALELQVLSETLPGSRDEDIHAAAADDRVLARAYSKTEDAWCAWTARTESSTAAVRLPADEVLPVVEDALHSWACALRACKHWRAAAITAMNDVAGSRAVAAESARLLAARAAAMEEESAENTDWRPDEPNSRAPPPPPLTQPLSSRPTAAPAASPPPERCERAMDSLFLCSEQYTEPVRRYPLHLRSSRSVLEGSAATTASHSSSVAHARQPLERAESEAPCSVAALLRRVCAARDGALDDAAAEALFKSLTAFRQEGSHARVAADGALYEFSDADASYVTAAELAQLLMTIHPSGVFLDGQDRSPEQLARLRARLRAAVNGTDTDGADRARNGNGSDGVIDGAAADSAPPATGMTREAADRDGASTGSALARMVKRHDATRERCRAEAMDRLAADATGRFAFRQSGRLYYDEFCLALMHLLM